MKTHSQAPTRFRVQRLPREISLIFGASTMLALPMALAAPQGGTVTAGQASIVNNGALTTITQGSQRAAIDWRSFNVGASETVNFVQPNASAAILNRVVGNDPSAIFGRITGNGQVLLINPNGILFGRTAQVDVGALTATTSNLSNADFMAARLNFTEPGKAGATVENQGRITVAEGGFVALVGRQVANSGVINARLGKVALAGGDAFVLDLYGDKLVNLIVDPAAMNALTDAQGQPLAARVDHSGEIVAEGGRVQLSVATVKQLVDNLINLSGVVRATSFTNAAGVISLQGDANTRVNVSGTLDTSGGDRGGRIEATGREVNLQSGATLAATGGQGSIAVGGDWQGRGTLAHADNVNVAQGATLDASGGTHGDGGTVVLWSDKNTQFAGRIDANGGSVSGNAGQVEVSSKGTLGFQGDVGVFSTNGNQGSLLLDPLNLTIAATSSGDSQVSADQIRYFLTRGTNVTLSADQNVTVNAEVNGLVTGGGGTAGGGLTLTAGNNLAVNQNIVLNNGALNLTATNGTLSQANGTVLYTGTGAANLRGGAGVDLGQLLSGGAVDIRSASGAVNVRNAIVSATSNGAAAPVASLNIDGAGAVSLNGALMQGDATIRSRNAGVSLATAVVQSVAGNVQMNAGTTIASAAADVGLVAGGNVTATAGGAIDLGAVISAGMATLNSSGGGVTLRQAVTGNGTAAAGGLSINAGGPVSLAGARTGAGGIAITTSVGNITSTSTSAAQGGLVSDGGVTLHADAGQAGTMAAPLNIQAAGNVLVDGQTGVTLANLLSPGTVTIEANAGGVTFVPDASATPTLRPIAGSPTAITVTARDSIDLAGGTAGAGGIHITSTEGSVTLRSASLFSSGPVSVTADDAITTLDNAGIATTTGNGSVTLISSGTLTLGAGGIRADGDAVNITLQSTGNMAINGDVQTRSGTIDLTSTNGSVVAMASYSGTDSSQEATLDAGTHATRSVIRVNGQTSVELGELIAYNLVDVSSDAGNVVLKRGLGGNTSGTFGGQSVLLNTGYVDYASGYQAQYRPNVGRVLINAPLGSVELNGLNLDGNASPTSTDYGLNVSAGHVIVSNQPIAVNKGDIRLAGGTAGSTDGVYLGEGVFSRGYDTVVAGAHQKVGYGIRIEGRVLGLFDNTAEMALLPVNTFMVSWTENGATQQARVDAQGFLVDTTGIRVVQGGSYRVVGYLPTDVQSNGAPPDRNAMRVYSVDSQGRLPSGTEILTVQGIPELRPDGTTGAVQQQIAKIEIANNVANYQDYGTAPGSDQRGTLVPATSSVPGRGHDIVIDSQTIAGVANSDAAVGAIRLNGFAPQLTTLRQTPSAVGKPGLPAATPDPALLVTGYGVGLKLLGFEEAGDESSTIWANTLQLTGGSLGNGAFFGFPGGVSGANSVPVRGAFSVIYLGQAVRSYSLNGVVTTDTVGTINYRFEFIDGSTQQARLVDYDLEGVTVPALPQGATLVSDWQFTPRRAIGDVANVRMTDPFLKVHGTAGGVVLASNLYPSVATSGTSSLQATGGEASPDYRFLSPDYALRSGGTTLSERLQSGSFFTQGYQIQNILVDSTITSATLPANAPGTRVFVYDGIINAANGSFVADNNSATSIPALSGLSGFNNSSVGFAGVGAGFNLASGVAGSTGVGSTTGHAPVGAGIPGGQAGTGAPPTVDDRSTQEVSHLVGVAAGAGPAGALGDVIFSSSPSAQADLGRGSALSGPAVNVFKRRYRVASATPGTVCAPGVIQTSPDSAGAPAADCPGAP